MDFQEKQFIRLREKQSNCIHPSWKCSLCGLYKDNIKDEQRLKIEYLEKKIAQYELLLHNMGVFCQTTQFVEYKETREKQIDKAFPRLN